MKKVGPLMNYLIEKVQKPNGLTNKHMFFLCRAILLKNENESEVNVDISKMLINSYGKEKSVKIIKDFSKAYEELTK